MHRFLVVIVPVIAALTFGAYAIAGGETQHGKIVFMSEHGGQPEIWVMNADGSDRRNLTHHNGANVADVTPAWSPNGRRIAFSSSQGGAFRIWVMNGDGSGAFALPTPASAFFPAWLPNGRQIVFQSDATGDSELYRINVDGTGLTNLTNNPAGDFHPAVAPDGRRIAFSSDRSGSGRIYVMAADGSLTQITNGPGDDFEPSWSPNGKQVVFARAAGSGTSLYIVRADGSGERQLTSAPGIDESTPVFSPDGKSVAFTACDGFATSVDERCTVHTIRVDGTDDTSLGFPTLTVTAPFLDNFDTNARNVDLWHTIFTGVGAAINDVNRRVEIDFAAASTPDPGSNIVGGGQGLTCLLPGDFDVQVDYALATWPTPNGVTATLSAFGTDLVVGRQSQPWGESYVATGNGGVTVTQPTADMSGSLRLVRNGLTETSYVRSGTGDWVELQSTPSQPGPAVVSFEGNANTDVFPHQEVNVAFDNFRLNAGVTQECGSWRPDVQPSWRGGESSDR